MSFIVNRRSGLPTLLELAKKMCRIIVTFTPAIQKLYGENAALMAALAAANVACHELEQEISEAVLPGD